MSHGGLRDVLVVGAGAARARSGSWSDCRPRTSLDVLGPVWSPRSSATTSRRSLRPSAGLPATNRCRVCHPPSAPSSAMGDWPANLPDSSAAHADWNSWSGSRARTGRSVPVAARGAWRSVRRIWSTPCCRTCPSDKWVLTAPARLRYQFTWNHGLCRMVTGVVFRAIGRVPRERAGDNGVAEGRSGGASGGG